MSISGFSMVRNATKLYFPIKESIESILPIVDEFVIAVGAGDEDDNTRKVIESIDSDKVKIIDTEWDLEKYPNGTENAHQTDIAKEACSGDWLFYLQADEVVHEQFLPEIEAKCELYANDQEVEGLLLKYKHFWGDYNHYHLCHGWYAKEIRIIKNRPDIHSWESAQSFRRIPSFDYKNYRQQEGTYKLKVKQTDAYVYHYGWVRPPELMQNKKKALDTIHKGSDEVQKIYQHQAKTFDYGPLKYSEKFKGTHPKVMTSWIEQFDWGDQLYEEGKIPDNRTKFKHEILKNRLISIVEQKLLGGKTIFAFKNYHLLK